MIALGLGPSSALPGGHRSASPPAAPAAGAGPTPPFGDYFRRLLGETGGSPPGSDGDTGGGAPPAMSARRSTATDNDRLGPVSEDERGNDTPPLVPGLVDLTPWLDVFARPHVPTSPSPEAGDVDLAAGIGPTRWGPVASDAPGPTGQTQPLQPDAAGDGRRRPAPGPGVPAAGPAAVEAPAEPPLGATLQGFEAYDAPNLETPGANSRKTPAQTTTTREALPRQSDSAGAASAVKVTAGASQAQRMLSAILAHGPAQLPDRADSAGRTAARPVAETPPGGNDIASGTQAAATRPESGSATVDRQAAAASPAPSSEGKASTLVATVAPIASVPSAGAPPRASSPGVVPAVAAASAGVEPGPSAAHTSEPVGTASRVAEPRASAGGASHQIAAAPSPRGPLPATEPAIGRTAVVLERVSAAPPPPTDSASARATSHLDQGAAPAPPSPAGSGSAPRAAEPASVTPSQTETPVQPTAAGGEPSRRVDPSVAEPAPREASNGLTNAGVSASRTEPATRQNGSDAPAPPAAPAPTARNTAPADPSPLASPARETSRDDARHAATGSSAEADTAGPFRVASRASTTSNDQTPSWSPGRANTSDETAETARFGQPGTADANGSPLPHPTPVAVAPHQAAAVTVRTDGPGLTPGSASSPVDNELPDQIVQSLKLQATQGGGEARVLLRPEYLGELTVRVVVEHGVVTARLEADVPAVREWIERHEGSLRQALGEHGLKLEELVVSDKAERRDADGRDREPHSDGRDRDEPSPQRRRRREDGQAPRFEVVV